MFKQTPKYSPRERINSSPLEYICYFISYTTNESINDNKNDDLHPSTSCLTLSVYVLLTTSQSIDDDVIHQKISTGIVISYSLDICLIHGNIPYPSTNAENQINAMSMPWCIFVFKNLYPITQMEGWFMILGCFLCSNIHSLYIHLPLPRDWYREMD